MGDWVVQGLSFEWEDSHREIVAATTKQGVWGCWAVQMMKEWEASTKQYHQQV